MYTREEESKYFCYHTRVWKVWSLTSYYILHTRTYTVHEIRNGKKICVGLAFGRKRGPRAYRGIWSRWFWRGSLRLSMIGLFTTWLQIGPCFLGDTGLYFFIARIGDLGGLVTPFYDYDSAGLWTQQSTGTACPTLKERLTANGPIFWGFTAYFQKVSQPESPATKRSAVTFSPRGPKFSSHSKLRGVLWYDRRASG